MSAVPSSCAAAQSRATRRGCRADRDAGNGGRSHAVRVVDRVDKWGRLLLALLINVGPAQHPAIAGNVWIWPICTRINGWDKIRANYECGETLTSKVIYAAVETPVIGSGRQRSAAATNGGPPILCWSPLEFTGEQLCLLPPRGPDRFPVEFARVQSMQTR
ncbi:hypothetical protein B0H17DRAFT_1147039 [Mycena rosella]|uniref:Uncharacterized protein n=1 Tax=Mycena rosella TaxID=1033263 RepID=A0AAD7CMN1_MYCRO|nr:hypothetical protein B0H17DRAFT_1147039 [Mycena rosella]